MTKRRKVFPLSLKIKVILLVISTLFLLPPLPFLPSLNVLSQQLSFHKPSVKMFSLKLDNLPPYPVHLLRSDTPYIDGRAFLVKDLTTKVVMAQKNEDKKLAIASLTKLMTAWVALKVFPPKKIITVTIDSKDVDGQVIGLKKGEKYSLESLVAGMIIHSANDAAENIAAAYPGGVKAFVKEMNHQAKLLHMENSHFTNPVGYDDPHHYSTAFDLSLLVDKVLEDPLISAFAQAPMMEIVSVNTGRLITLTTTNDLLGQQPGVLGLKTGWTPRAGECLISLIKSPSNHWYVIILLGSKDRFGETIKLKNWVNSNFSWQPLQ